MKFAEGHWRAGNLKMARISQVVRETPTIATLVLDISLEAQPGQFVMLWLPGVDEKPFSLAEMEPAKISVARVGPFTTRLHQLQPGALLGLRGPFGRGYTLLERGPVLLVGGGCGGPPLYPLARLAWERGLEVQVALGARTAAELAFQRRFQELGCRVVLTTDDGSGGMMGKVTDALPPLLEGVKAIYACGPEPMLKWVAELCWERGLPGQLSLERYMKCGLGLCGQCALDGLLVCRDGPVFAVEELRRVKEFGKTRRDACGREVPV